METQLRTHELFAWPTRVYYEDTDSGGVVYYANYFKFAERARTELLRKAGISQENCRKSFGYGFMVRQCQAEYLLPACLDDELIVITQITAINAASIDFYQEIKREVALLVKITSQIVCVGVNGKPQRIPADIRLSLV